MGLVGAKNPAARLSAKDVCEIRTMYGDKTLTLKALASLFGVDIKTIWKIVHRETWKHVGKETKDEV